MINFFLVFLGGGLGSICRYGIAYLLQQSNYTFPLATFLANVISCVFLGFLVGLTLKENLHQHYKLLLMTGFCGGFSTFSTFSAETFQLFQTGETAYAFLNIFGSIVVCLGCIFIGMKMAS